MTAGWRCCKLCAGQNGAHGRIRGMRSANLHKTMAPSRENCLFRRPNLPLGPVLEAMRMASEPIIIKRYANHRLYHPAAGGYVTLEDLALMVEDEERFEVREAGTGKDVTGSILREIIIQ